MNRLLIVGILIVSTAPLFAQVQPDPAKLKNKCQRPNLKTRSSIRPSRTTGKRSSIAVYPRHCCRHPHATLTKATYHWRSKAAEATAWVAVAIMQNK